MVGLVGRCSLLPCYVGLAGCSPEVTELSIDVVTDGHSFDIYSREV